MNELDLLALKYGTDKASDFHNYTEFYDKYFNLDRGNIKNVLEIGVFRGNSLRMWKDYFFNAIIYGIDIDKNCNFTEERIKILIDELHAFHSQSPDLKVNWFTENTKGIHFYDSVVVFEKKKREKPTAKTVGIRTI